MPNSEWMPVNPCIGCEFAYGGKPRGCDIRCEPLEKYESNHALKLVTNMPPIVTTMVQMLC